MLIEIKDLYINQLFKEIISDNNIHKVTKYVTEKFTVKLTRIGKQSKKVNLLEFKVTMGKPNYLERKFISKCKKAGEPFPVKKIQIKYYPKKK